jgi:ATP-binding cassette, subfamily B, bacterial MsbA
MTKLRHSVDRQFSALDFRQNQHVLLRELQYFPRIVGFALVFSVIAAFLEGSGIGLLLAFLQGLINPTVQPLQTGITWFDAALLGVDTSAMERLFRLSGLILAVSWLRAYFNYLGWLYLEKSQAYLIDRLRKRVFEQLQALRLSFFTKSNTGSIISVVTNELADLQQVCQTAGFIFTRFLILLVYSAIAVWISWPLFGLTIACFSLVGVGASKLNAQIRAASFEISTAQSQVTKLSIEFINGIRTVQAFVTQDFERQRYYQASNDVVAAKEKVVVGWATVRSLVEALSTTILIGVIVLGITVFVANGSLQVSALLTFVFLVFRLLPSIQDIVSNIARLASFKGATKSIEQLLRTDDKPYLQNGSRNFAGLNDSIKLQAVSFGYQPDSLVLQNISLTVPKGSMVALVGTSGAGKTTLADLIPRFYDPTDGYIYFDDIDLCAYNIHSVRRRMAIVSQDTFIFNASIRDNIAYGSATATDQAITDQAITDQAIIEAAQLANALDFILDLPQGFDTELGDRGVRLSGGQRQRIAIARALLHDPEILILDEATSALDSASERLIQESLEKLSIGRTVIAIAHRLSTITRADMVVVLEQGRILEQGRYQDLLAQRGALWNYHQIQYGLGQLDPIS